jgi:hypothetical protein
MLDSERPSIKLVLSYLVLWVLHYAAKKLQKKLCNKTKQKSHHWFWEVIFFYWNYIFKLYIDESTFSITLTVSNMQITELFGRYHQNR